VAQAAASSESSPAPVTTVVTDSKASDGKTAAKTAKATGSWTQAKASAVIDWYAEHGIEVQTITKSDGITYPVLTESAMRAAAEVKGVPWDEAAWATKKAAVAEKKATWSQQQAGAK
jgi:hypothetical protein